MQVHLVNPSDMSFGTAVITPRWLYVLAAATPASFGDPLICDGTLRRLDPSHVQPGDVVGIGIHTGNALRSYEVGRMVRGRRAWVVFGGIHATLYPEEAFDLEGAHSVVKGDGDVVWAEVLKDCLNGAPEAIYEGGRIEPDQFLPARWDLLPDRRSADAQSIAHFVRYGAPMASGQGSALPTASSRRLFNYGARAFGSSP